MDHTKEPWTVNALEILSAVGTWIADCWEKEVGDDEAEANARRIVACVNACAGMEDPAAELSSLRSALADERDNNARHAEARAREVSAFEQAIAERNAELMGKTAQVDALNEILCDNCRRKLETKE